MYSVTVPVGEAPSHVVRQVPSLRRHVCATQVAMATQAWSFGQLVALQQLAATQLAHVEAPMLKISAAAGQRPPSPSSAPLSLAMPPSPGGEPPPPAAGPPHVVPLVGMQGPICCGWSLVDEQAHASASAASAASAVAIARARPVGSHRRPCPPGPPAPPGEGSKGDGGDGDRDDVEKEGSTRAMATGFLGPRPR